MHDVVRALLADLALGLRFGHGAGLDESYLTVVGYRQRRRYILGAAIDTGGCRNRIMIDVADGTHQISRLTLTLLQLGHTSHSIAQARRDAPVDGVRYRPGHNI